MALTHSLHTLPNGMTVLIEELPVMRSVSVGILVGFGSKHEVPDKGGIAHFIEHMLFKGTARRTPQQIAEEIDAVGGRINAHTSKEYTSYYAIVLDNHVDLAVDILSDMYLNSLFKQEEIDRERNVILEEISMYEDTPDEKIHDLAAQNIWDGHVLGNPIIGTVDSVKAMTREDMLDCMRTHYTPDNTIIAIAGNVNTAEVLALVTEKFGSATGKKQEISIPETKVVPGTKVIKKKTEQAHLCLSVKGVSYLNTDRFTFSILSSVLGGSMSSRLFQKVREEKGLVYSIYSYPTFYREGGLFTIYVGMQLKAAHEVLDIIQREVRSIRDTGITVEELYRAKEQLKGHMVLNMEDTSSRMSWLLKSKYYYEKVQSVEDVMAKVDAVTAGDVQRLANEFFISEDIQLTAIGNFPTLKYFKPLAF